LEFLSALGQREAIAFGDGVSLPVRIRFDEMPKEFLPRSSGAAFTKQWQHSDNDEAFLEQLVERWRSAGLGAPVEAGMQAAQLMESMGAANVGAEDSYAAPAPARVPGTANEALRVGASAIPRREPIAATANSAVAQRRAAPVTPPVAAPSSGGARSLRERLMTRS
jgi:uncharacterized protein